MDDVVVASLNIALAITNVIIMAVAVWLADHTRRKRLEHARDAEAEAEAGLEPADVEQAGVAQRRHLIF